MIKYIIWIAVAVLGVWCLSSCLKDDDDAAERNMKEGREYMEKNAQREGVITTGSGLQYEVIREGEGKTPSITSRVVCHYEGRLVNGRVFDSSLGGDPIEFPLQNVIAGWIEGLQLMKEGAKYRFVIPYQLAYGSNGYGVIPPCATLIFEVELLEVK